MSEFRIFCIGAMAATLICGLIGTRLGDAAVKGSVASSMVTLLLFATGGIAAVALFGKRSA